MKKRLCLILIGAVLALSACSGGVKTGEAVSPTAAETSSETQGQITVKRDMDTTYEYETRELWCENNGNRIYGKAFIPKVEGVTRFPLIIHAHGMGSNHEAGEGFCKRYAEHGFASYTFDFPGGSKPSNENKSDGDPLQMSPVTEAADLQAILDTALTWDFVDPAYVFLEGGSQGGLVATMVGLDNIDTVHGMILHYPALYMPQNIASWFNSPEDVPESLSFGDDYTLGKKFAVDLFGVDVVSRLGEFDKNVLILQGSEDALVHPQMIEEASHSFPHCDFIMIEGSGHGFSGEYFNLAVKYGLEYLFENT